MNDQRKKDKGLLIAGCALLFIILNAPIGLNIIKRYFYIKDTMIIISISLIIAGLIKYLFIKHLKITVIEWILKHKK